MTEGSERKDVTVDRKDGGPPKVETNHPKWEVSLKQVIADFDFSFKKGHTRFEKGHYKQIWILRSKKGILRWKKGILDLKKDIVKTDDLKNFKNLLKWEILR